MRLKFLGTRGDVEESSRKHKYHSSLLVTHKGFKLLIDHGLISIPLRKIKPDAIIVTHAHPDHFTWLKKDEEYKGKIYVTRETKRASKFKKNFEVINIDKWFKVGPFKILGYRVIHSLIAPAIGFKIKGNKTFIYNPDLIVMKRKSVLKGIDLYIGDGSTVTANLVRRKDSKLFGHTRIQTQVNWCKKYGIKEAIFTHFGKEPIRWGDKKLEKKFKQEEVNVKIAHDNMTMTL